MPAHKRWGGQRVHRTLVALTLLGILGLWFGIARLGGDRGQAPAEQISPPVQPEPVVASARVDVDALDRAAVGLAGEEALRGALALRVVDAASGVPVSGARVWVLSGRADSLPQGVTGEDGSLSVRVIGTQHAMLLTLAEGYAASKEAIPSSRSGMHTVALEREGRIIGRLAFGEGEPIDSGIVALAWPSDHYPSPERLLLATDLGHDGWIATAPVTVDGGFELRGLHPNRRYTVCAAGPGCLVVEPPQGIRPGHGEVQLTLSAIYGTAVAVLGVGGQPLAVDDAVAQEPTVVEGLTSDIKWLTRSRWMPWLVLVGGESLTDSTLKHGWNLSTYLFATSDSRSGVSFDLHVEAPGYVAAQRRLLAPRVLGALGVQQVRIEDRLGFDARGSLRVLFTGPGASLLRDGVSSSGGTRAYLSLLRADDPGGRPLQIALDLPQDDGRTIAGLPIGEYSAVLRFERGTGSPTAESLAVTVLPGGKESLLVYELHGFGMAILEVVDEDGLPFGGRIQLLVGRETQRRSGTRYRSVADAFQSDPYVFGPLSPGRYIAVVDSFPGRKVRPGARITFEVVENGFAFPTLALTDFLEP